MGEGRADEVFKLIAAAPAQGIVLVRSVLGAASTKHLAPDAERYAGEVNTLQAWAHAWHNSVWGTLPSAAGVSQHPDATRPATMSSARVLLDLLLSI